MGQGMQCRTCCVGSVAWDVVVCGVAAPSPSLTPTHTGKRIGDEGAAAVSKSLEVNSVLTSLNLASTAFLALTSWAGHFPVSMPLPANNKTVDSGTMLPSPFFPTFVGVKCALQHKGSVCPLFAVLRFSSWPQG